MYTDPVAIAGAHRAERDPADRRRRGAGGAGPGADRGAQRLRHRRPAPHGRRHAGGGRPAGRLHARHREDRADRHAGHARQVADLVRMKDPADAAYGCAPARFVRATRAVAPPSSMMGMRAAIGETEFEQQQILGYAPVEPDGSFKLQVPADTPLALAVVDAKGRGIQTHLNWIQVRPGERRTCDGCHSPRRGGAHQLRRGRQHHAGGAASRRCRASTSRARRWPRCARASTPTRCDLKPDMVFSDIWADTAKPGVAARAPIVVRYTGNADAGRRPGHARAGERHHQLPGAHRAALDARPRRQHLHQLPRRPGQARPARHHRRHRPPGLVRGVAARRPADRPGHRPAA